MTGALLFAAHDMGGGRVLLPIIDACRAGGYRTAVVARGPARDVLAPAGRDHTNDDMGRVMTRLRPLAVVSGTSATARLEHDLWDAARRVRVPSMAILDASINLRQRFEVGQPDVICVVDEASRLGILGGRWCSARVEVVGQPHLERIAAGRGPCRRLAGGEGRFVYMSEPIATAPGEAHPIGYDQFSVAQTVLAALAGLGRVSLVIKPHPVEPVRRWRDWLSGAGPPTNVVLEVATADALALMAGAHGVIGLGSMALTEAALAGIPTLALQPGRRYCPNPRIDADPAIVVITEPARVAPAVRGFAKDAITEAGAGSTVKRVTPRPFEGSTARVMTVIEDLVGAQSAAPAAEAGS